MKAQRLRITFARGEEMQYITHLDLMRFWERALRRAEIPLAYSEGFSPHAQISLAAPLPVGTTSEAELMDVYLSTPMTPRDLLAKLAAQIPPGIRPVEAKEVGMNLPALQADVRFAEYVVDVDLARDDDVFAADAPGPDDTGGNMSDEMEERVAPPPRVRSLADAERQVEAFLASDSIPWQHKRQEEMRSYDIRAQVAALTLDGANGGAITLRMRLQNDSGGSGRPEQVVAALGLPPPSRIHRTKLILHTTSAAREAWRTRGRFAE
jgi:hypothetical protein